MYTVWISQRVSVPGGGAVWNDSLLADWQAHFSVSPRVLIPVLRVGYSY